MESHDGEPTAAFKTKITAALTEQGAGREAVNYKLRDWLFSRQRFWGEPLAGQHGLVVVTLLTLCVRFTVASMILEIESFNCS